MVLYLHPFAEEMNKARRMAALQARALAGAGFEVLQVDLLGCGDSSGDFSDASWDAWLDDGLTALRWLQARGEAPVWLWGLRVGGLLAADLARRLDSRPGLLLWNPVSSGKQFLQQFLRLKLASGAGEQGGKAAMAQIRARLNDGESIEVAGYRLSPTMAAQLESVELTAPVAASKIRLLETSTRSEPGLSPAAQNALAGFDVLCEDLRAISVRGPAFWQTTEIEEAPDLLPATIEAVLN